MHARHQRQLLDSLPFSIYLVLASVVSAGLSAQTRDTAKTLSTPRSLSAPEWQADVDQLVTALREIHPEPFAQISEAEFDARVGQLRKELPGLSDHQIVLRMAALVAAVRDGHTRLTLPVAGAKSGPRMGHSPDPEPNVDIAFHRLPVTFDLFDDGLYVVQAVPEYRQLIGARVDSIGTLETAAALARMRAITFVDNEQTFELLAPERLSLVEALIDLGVAPPGDGVGLDVILDDGTEQSIRLQSFAEDVPNWIGPTLPASDLPVWLRGDGKLSRWSYETPYRSEYLSEADTMYLQINEITNDGTVALAEFMGSALDLAATNQADRLVIDLRKNHGGSGSWNRAILLALVRSDYADELGRLYVLIGRRTFSAAIMLVGLLERWTDAIFVGEPTGSPLNQFGDPEKFQLDHSGLTVRVSTILWHSWLAADNRPAFPPHIGVDFGGADFFGGRDPVLEAALEHRVGDTMEGRFGELLAGDVNHAAIWGLRKATDPAIPGRRVEDAILRAGRAFCDRGDLELGRYAFLVGLSIFPTSVQLEEALEEVAESAD